VTFECESNLRQLVTLLPKKRFCWALNGVHLFIYFCYIWHVVCQGPRALVSGGELTASSKYSANHAASQGVLNNQKNSGSWSARTNDYNQWFQVDLGKTMKVTRVATQGRYSGFNQWVTKYKLQYSDDGVNFQYYKEQGQTTDKVIFCFK